MLKVTDITAGFRLFAGCGLANGPNSKEATEIMVESWLVVLEDMEPADFQQACRKAARKSAFWPKPSDILEYSTGAAVAKVEEAERRINWFPIVQPTRSSAGKGATDARLRHCFNNYARSRLGITPDDEGWRRVNRAVEAIGGWDGIGDMTERNLGYAEGRFLKAMEARQEPDNVLSLADEQARRKRLPHGNPKRIGGG